MVRIKRDWTVGPCEFGTGEVTFNPAPRVHLCGKPGKARDDVTWIEMYACDECYDRWKNHPNRKREKQ